MSNYQNITDPRIEKTESPTRSWTFYPSLFSTKPVIMSVSVLPHGIQIIKRVGVRWLHEDGRNDDNTQAFNEAIKSHSSDDAVNVAKAELATHLFRKYYCSSRYNIDNVDLYGCSFAKKKYAR